MNSENKTGLFLRKHLIVYKKNFLDSISYMAKNLSVSGYVFLGIFAFEMIVLLIFNSKTLFFLDFDSSVWPVQVVEIWRQKTFLLSEWSYQNTLGWDTNIPFEVLIYSITKNLFLAIGLTNVIVTVLYTAVIVSICVNMRLKPGSVIFTLCIVFVLYSGGQLGYASMLFYSTGCYGMKVMLLMLSIDVLLKFHNSKKGKLLNIEIFFCLFLAFISGMSSQMQTLGFAVIPIFIYEIILWIKKDDIRHLKSKEFVFAFLLLICCVIGCLLLKKNPEVFGMEIRNIQLCSLEKFSDNFHSYWLGYLELFGAVTVNGGYSPLSGTGIMHLSKLCILLFIVAGFIYSCIGIFNNKRRQDMALIASVSFCVSTLLLLVIDTKYGSPIFESRYLLFAVLPVMPLAGDFFDRISKSTNKMLKIVVYAGMSLMILTAQICSTRKEVKEIKEVKQVGVPYDSSNIAYYNSVIDQILKKDIRLAFFTYGEGFLIGRISAGLNAFRQNTLHISCIADPFHFAGWGTSTKFADNASFAGRVAWVGTAKDYSNLPFYAQKALEIQDETDGLYNIHYAESNIFDFESGLPKAGILKSVDFPYSSGYRCSEDIDSNGWLTTSQNGYILYGPSTQAIPGIYDFILNYEIPDQAAQQGDPVLTFDIALDTQSIAAVQLDRDCGTAELNGVKIDGEGLFEARVYNENGAIISIKSIEMYRKGP